MAKIQLKFKQKDSGFGYKETSLSHIKAMNDDGSYIKFAKHTPEIIEYISRGELNIPDAFIK